MNLKHKTKCVLVKKFTNEKSVWISNYIYYFMWGAMSRLGGSGHGTVAVLLPGFAISRYQNQVTRQPQFHNLTQVMDELLESYWCNGFAMPQYVMISFCFQRQGCVPSVVSWYVFYYNYHCHNIRVLYFQLILHGWDTRPISNLLAHHNYTVMVYKT